MPSRAVTHHDNLDDVVDEHAQLSAPPPTIHRPHVRSFHSSRAYTSSVYTDDWYSRSPHPAVLVSERIYFGLNGKLVRFYKIRNYRVCRSCIQAGTTTHFKIDSSISIPKSNTASPKTYPRLVSGHATRHRFFPHPVLSCARGIPV